MRLVLALQTHIKALPDLDMLEAYWQHANSVLPHEKRDSQKILADMQILHKVHFADLLQSNTVTQSPLVTAQTVAKQTLRQVSGNTRDWECQASRSYLCSPAQWLQISMHRACMHTPSILHHGSSLTSCRALCGLCSAARCAIWQSGCMSAFAQLQ